MNWLFKKYSILFVWRHHFCVKMSVFQYHTISQKPKHCIRNIKKYKHHDPLITFVQNFSKIKKNQCIGYCNGSSAEKVFLTCHPAPRKLLHYKGCVDFFFTHNTWIASVENVQLRNGAVVTTGPLPSRCLRIASSCEAFVLNDHPTIRPTSS